MGYQYGKLVFTEWARGDIIENMLKDHRSADYNDGKKTDVSFFSNSFKQAIIQSPFFVY